MRTYFILILCFLFISGCKEKNPETDEVTTALLGKWVQKSNFPGEMRYDAFGFSLNDRIYVGSGHHYYFIGNNSANNIYNDFWEYDPSADVWTRKADLPFPGILSVASFTISNKGYIATGFTDEPKLNEYTYSNALWQYDPLLDEWTQKAPFPGEPRMGAVGFSTVEKGYVGLGGSVSEENNITYFSDLWQYDAITDSWFQKQSFSGHLQGHTLSLSTTHFGYVIESLYNKPDACWSYNFITDEWAKVKALEEPYVGGSIYTTGFVLNDYVYYKPSYRSSSQPLADYTSDFWMYDAQKDDWYKMAFTPGYDLPGKIGFAVKNKGYLLLGHNFSARSVKVSNEVWEYTPE